MCSDLLSHFSAIKEPRSDKNKRYDLEEILRLHCCPTKRLFLLRNSL